MLPATTASIHGDSPAAGRREVDVGRLLELAPHVVLLLDADLGIRWVSEAVSSVLGYRANEVVGRSIVDFLDPNWDPDAFASIATALSSTGLRQPMLFRALAKDGSRPIIEATANVQFDDPALGGMIVYARRATEQWLLDRTLESVAASEPVVNTLELLVRVAGAETLDAQASYVFDRFGDRAAGVVGAEELAPALCGPSMAVSDAAAEQWSALLDIDDGRVHDVADLAEPLRSTAQDAGFHSLWIFPADHDAQHTPKVWALAWRRQPRLDADQTRTGMMGRLAMLAALAIGSWRSAAANAYAAEHDAMTGLPNRSTVLDHLSNRLSNRVDSTDGDVGVVFLDLDGFKPVNDRFGHSAGDRILVAVAERLAVAAPVDGVLGRFGGDEFVYVGPAGEPGHLESVAADLADALADPVELRSGEVVSVGVSVGVASCAPEAMSADELVETADHAQYQAKLSGGGIASAVPGRTLDTN